jgi:hypothetical protein
MTNFMDMSKKLKKLQIFLIFFLVTFLGKLFGNFFNIFEINIKSRILDTPTEVILK